MSVQPATRPAEAEPRDTTISIDDRSTPAGPQADTTGFVRSRDGTTIGYRQYGRGAGLVLLHGTMSSAHNHLEALLTGTGARECSG